MIDRAYVTIVDVLSKRQKRILLLLLFLHHETCYQSAILIGILDQKSHIRK